MSRISVIIPCYNRASLIGETLENMLHQSLRPYEVIVVDDGSTDNSVAVIKSFGPSVTLIEQPNQGPGVARNAGFRASSGDFIQFMDSDDLASNNKLEDQVKALIDSDADFAYSPWVRSKIQDNTILFLDNLLQVDKLPVSKPMLEWFLSGWSLVFQNCLFRRSLIESTGGYRSDLMPSEDSEYFIRILLAGATPIHTPSCLVFYREHDINKITASGTSSLHRARDWTHFLNIAGGLLNNKIEQFKFSTKIAIASAINDHQKYCSNNNLPGVADDNPLGKIKVPLKRQLLKLFSLYKRIDRKISKSADHHFAFQAKRPTKFYRDLIEGINYKDGNK
jgi:glycosyltransferase involved in cell wall biosynthesis